MLFFGRWTTITILAVTIFGILAAIPNLFGQKAMESWPSYIPQRVVQLGLDLQGGSHLLLEMNSEELKADWLETIRDDVRNALQDAKVRAQSPAIVSGRVQVRVREAADFDKALAAVQALSQPLGGSVFGGPQTRDLIVTGQDGAITVEPSEAAFTNRVTVALGAAQETIRRRVDQLGTTEPIIARQGTNRILLQVPGLEDPQQLKDLVGRTAKLSFRLVDRSMTAAQARAGRPPAASELVPSDDGDAVEYLLEKRVIVSGEELVDAQPGFDGRTNEPIVSFRFNQSGARKFGRTTQENVGFPFAIVLDGKVISAPVIRDAILGGSGQISGNFTVQGANDLAILLRSGALPASMTIVEERTVGPSLGADSIAAGTIAGLIGFVAVVAYMVVNYGFFGVIASIALAVNMVLLLGGLSLLKSTLTLPGIAGIVLTIGMAVDGNVIIFERIRDELRGGKTPISAIDTGFTRGMGTIIDANLTTLIAAVVLFWLGSGPIRGFAVTLSIGVLTSVFTVFLLTRLMVAVWVRQARPKAVPI